VLITLKEYAAKHSRELSGLRRKAIDGRFNTAVKIGRDWFIDEDEPLTDQRIKHGRMIGQHKLRKEKINK
jgi:DNA (cytosine-5)-methyltransferase 1